MTARTTQPRPSKGPLGERGRRLQERLGVVPLAAITRRGVVPERLRASWSCLAAAAKAAGQPANCRRHEGWSRSPSPRTRQGTRSLIGARFQPDWGKPNVRLIGGREETGASRLCRAARGASCLPNQECGWTLPCQWFGQLDDSDWSRRDSTRTGVWIGGCKGERDEQGDEDRVGRRRRGVDAGGPAPPTVIRPSPYSRLWVRPWMSAVCAARCQRSRGTVSHGKIRTGAISVGEGDHVRTAVIRPPL